MQNQTLSPDKYFYANDGKIFSSIDDLRRGLKEMSEETFHYHFNKEKNDFYNWILYVFNESELAKSIKKVKSQKGFMKKLKDYRESEKMERELVSH